MKICKNCGYVSDDDSISFCSHCGNLMELNVEKSNDDNFVPAAQTEIPVETAFPEVSAPKKPKKKLFLLIGIPVIVVILIIAIVCCLIFVFGKGPATQIANAAVKTIEAESFTVKIKSDGETISCKATLDFKNKDIGLLIVDEDDDITGIYDGYMFNINSYEDYDYYSGEYETKWSCYKQDVSEYIKLIFDEWENSKDIMKNGDINWDEIFDMLEKLDVNIDRDDVEEHINLDKTSDALIELFKLLNDEEWLEECMDYEKNKEGRITYHSFDADFSKVSDTVDELFADCTESSVADKILDSVVDELNDMDDDGAFVKTKIGIEKGYLSEIEIKAGEDSDSEKIKFEFSEVGSTKLDEKEMQEYLERCDEEDTDSTVNVSRDKLVNQYETKSYYFRQGYSDSWKINMEPTDGRLVDNYEEQNLALQLIPAAEATGVQYNIFCNWYMPASMTDSSADIATKVMDPDGRIYFNKINYIEPRDEYVQADTATPVTYNKMQWYQVNFTYIDQEGDQCKGVWNLLTEGTDFYIVSYEAKADKYDTYYAQFEEMINDFKKTGFETK